MSGPYMAQPLSREQIRNVANYLRKKLGLYNEKYFPVMQILELILPTLDPKFHYEVRPIAEMGSRHGMSYPEESRIELREDVYINACNGKGRDRMTVAHEIGHYILHLPKNIAFARTARNEEIPTYCNPEWQAGAFAGELLAPPHIIRGLSVIEVARTCGVSYAAAEKQLKHSC